MSQNITTLGYSVVADTSGFERGTVATRKELSSLKREFYDSISPIDKYNAALKRLNELKAGGLDTRLYETGLKKIRAEFNKGFVGAQQTAMGPGGTQGEGLSPLLNAVPGLSRFTAIAGPASAAIVVLGTAAAGAAVGYKLLASAIDVSTRNIAEQFKEIDRIGDTAEKLGIGAGALSKFESMARLADVEVETLTGALTKMQVKLGDAAMGGEASAKSFQAIGLNVDELIALGPEKAFGRISDAIGKLPSQAIKLNAINDIFGKGSTDIIRMTSSMAELEAQARRTGNVITDKQAASIDKADKQFKELGETFSGLWKQATVELAPAFGDLAEALAKMLQDPAVMDNFAGTFKAVAAYVQTIADTLPDIVDNAVVVTKITGGLLEGMAGFAGAGGISDAARGVKDEIAEAVRARKLDREMESRSRKDANGMNIENVRARFGLPDGEGGGGGVAPLEAFRRQMADDLYRQQKAQFDFVRGMEQAAAASMELNQKIGDLWAQSAGMSSRQLDLQEKLIAKTLEVSRKADEMGMAFGQERERAIQAAQQQVLAEAQMAMAREGMQIRDSLRTPIDTIRETLVRYQELVAFGALTQEEMNRAVGKQLFGQLGGGRVQSNPIATAGSQEFIAAQERNAQRSRVERLLADISGTLKLINKQPQLQVEQVQMQ